HHQAEADRDTADIFETPVVAQSEEHDPADDEQRRDCSDGKRQVLRVKRRANIGTEHDRESWRERQQPARRERRRHEAGRRAALEQSRHSDTRQERAGSAVQVAANPSAQRRSEAAQDTRRDHMRAPKEHAYSAGEIDKKQRSVHRALSFHSRRVGACLAWTGSRSGTSRASPAGAFAGASADYWRSGAGVSDNAFSASGEPRRMRLRHVPPTVILRGSLTLAPRMTANRFKCP